MAAGEWDMEEQDRLREKDIKIDQILSETKGIENQIEETYEVGMLVEWGAFITIRKGKHKATGKPCNIQVILKRRMTENAILMMKKEVLLLGDMQHPNLV